MGGAISKSSRSLMLENLFPGTEVCGVEGKSQPTSLHSQTFLLLDGLFTISTTYRTSGNLLKKKWNVCVVYVVEDLCRKLEDLIGYQGKV